MRKPSRLQVVSLEATQDLYLRQPGRLEPEDPGQPRIYLVCPKDPETADPGQPRIYLVCLNDPKKAKYGYSSCVRRILGNPRDSWRIPRKPVNYNS